MNSESSDQKSSSTGKSLLLLWQMCGIVAVAVLMGLAYNDASPLGLRSQKSDGELRIEADPSIKSPPPVVTNRVLATTSSLVPPPIPPPATSTVTVTPNANPPAVVAPTKFQELKWPEVKALLAAKKIVLVDARAKANYDISHIPGAISLPATSTATEWQAFAKAYPKDTRFVAYCGSDSCHMSHALADVLVKICGYTNVSVMPGGFAEFIIAEPNGGTQAPP